MSENTEGTIQRNWQHRVHKTKKNKIRKLILETIAYFVCLFVCLEVCFALFSFALLCFLLLFCFLNINGGHELRNSDHDPIMTVMEILKWWCNLLRTDKSVEEINYFTYFVPVFKYCYSDSRNLWTVMRAGGLAP
jgi:hypothetical protein